MIVLANHKGGVTKTTSTANLGATLAEAGRRVLIVDCDPQANLSEAFGWVEELPGERLEDLLANPAAAGRYTPPAALRPDVAPGLAWRERLRIIPSTDALADVAADLPVTGGPGYELRLREVLEPLREQFDLVLLDTPPGLGTLSGMAVLAADGLLIPALAVAALGMITMMLLGWPVAIFAGMVLFGAGFGVIESATFALLLYQQPEAKASALWNFAYDAGYGAGPAVFGLICVRTGYPAAFALTGALILAVVPAALRERKGSTASLGPVRAGR